MQTTRHRIDSGDGTILSAPERNRVMQVEVAGVDAFWVNPAWTGDWNVGGDRLWLAPEAVWNTAGRDPVVYQFPTAFDPGSWEVVADRPDGWVAQQQARMVDAASGRAIVVDVRRELTAIDVPEAGGFDRAVAYRWDERLAVVGSEFDDDRPIGLWHILQVPSGGWIEVGGVAGPPGFRDHLAPVRPDLVRRGEASVGFHLESDVPYKIGVSPAESNGRIGYLRPVADGYLAIVRIFNPDPALSYCDTPIAAVGTAGDAVQVYCDDGGFGAFGEMEYHSPAIAAPYESALAESCTTIAGLVRADDLPEWRSRWLDRTR